MKTNVTLSVALIVAAALLLGFVVVRSAASPVTPLAVNQATDGDVAAILSASVPYHEGTLWLKSNVPWTVRVRVEGAAIVEFRAGTDIDTLWEVVEDGDEAWSGSPGLFALHYGVRLLAGPRATVTFEVGWKR